MDRILDSASGDGARSHEPWVFVGDLDTHFARAEAGGATIVQGIRQTGYRAYEAEDLEGHRWAFAQARPSRSEASGRTTKPSDLIESNVCSMT